MADVTAKFSLNENNLNAQFNLLQEDNLDAVFVINAQGTTWGSISGEIQNQTDLYDILQDKASVEAVESLAETVQNNYTILDTKIDNTKNVLDNDISNLSDTVSGNYTTLDGKITNLTSIVNNNYTSLDGRITTNASNISSINSTISGFGNIVTHDVDEFATSAQGALANTALQPNDNISELVNDVGYITSASLPTDYVPNTRTINGYALSSNITLNYSDVGALSASTTINDLTTTAQQNALNSGANVTNISQITTNANNISDIQDLIPNQATSSNQLADKAFVNSSIATNTAYFIGTFNSVAELEAYSGTLTNNDYAFVVSTDAAGNTVYDRYKWNGSEWLFEYELNNSSFTAAQWSAINSGITSGDVSLIQTALQPGDNISELVNDVGYITSASLPTINNGTLDIQVNGTSIGTFTANQSTDTTANIVVPDSATWGNITGILSNQTDLQNALDNKLDLSGGTMTGFLTMVGNITIEDPPNDVSLDLNTNEIYGYSNDAYVSGQFDLYLDGNFIFQQYDSQSGADWTFATNGGSLTFSTSPDGNTYYTVEMNPSNGYLQIPTPSQNYSLVANDAAITAGWLKTNAMPLKQDTLVSGTNIKTINGNSILGSGDLTLDGLPSQTGQSGKFLTTNGTTASWATVTIPTPTYDSVNERITW